MRRPAGVTALSLFFLIGAAISGVSTFSLLDPGEFLEPMWRMNPRARQAFAGIGVWGVLLMLTVCLACAAAALGLWRGKRWGYWLAVGLLATNLAGDLINVLLGTEPRALIGVPVAAGLLVYLATRRVREFFRKLPDRP